MVKINVNCDSGAGGDGNDGDDGGADVVMVPCIEVECAKANPSEEWAKQFLSLKVVPEEFEPQRQVQQTLEGGFLKAMKCAGGGQGGWLQVMFAWHP